jgi:hypothetical protein
MDDKPPAEVKPAKSSKPAEKKAKEEKKTESKHAFCCGGTTDIAHADK